MNYYDPYQDSCAGTAGWQTIVNDMATFNQHLAADAAGAGVPLADVYTAFGGATTQRSCPYNSSTSYSWICSSYKDIHATTIGYGAVAGAFEGVYAPY